MLIQYGCLTTFRLIPFGFSLSRLINILCKSVGFAPILLLRPITSRDTLVALDGISLSKPAAALSLAATSLGVASSVCALLLGIFTALNGDVVGPDCSGGDGTGDDECLALTAVVLNDIPDLNANLWGPPPTRGEIQITRKVQILAKQ